MIEHTRIMAFRSLLAIPLVYHVTAQTYEPTFLDLPVANTKEPTSLEHRNNMSECGRSCVNVCQQEAMTCISGGHEPEGRFFKFLGCIYNKATRHEDDVECQSCLDNHHKLLTQETVDKCLGKEVEQVSDKCSVYEDAFLCKEASRDGCKWIDRKCYSTAEALTYNSYRQILFGVVDKKVCALLGGYVKRGVTCVARKVHHVKCQQINSRTLNPVFCPDCANICNWLPGCKYNVRKNKCLGFKPFGAN